MMAVPFDWELLHQPSAMAMVRGQLEFGWMVLSGRLSQVTDEQYFWQPSAEALTVVRRHAQRGMRVLGAGDWVAQWPDEPDDRTPRTIAWLIAHLTEIFFEQCEWTFGPRQQSRNEITLHGTAVEAVAWLTHWVDDWRRYLGGLDDDDAMTVGLSQASDLDASSPFGHVALQVNRELIHHGAEIMALQDLHQAAAA